MVSIADSGHLMCPLQLRTFHRPFTFAGDATFMCSKVIAEPTAQAKLHDSNRLLSRCQSSFKSVKSES